MASDTTADNPWPLALLNQKIKEYVNRMPLVWITGEVVEYVKRDSRKVQFFTLKDLSSNSAAPVKCYYEALKPIADDFGQGAKVVLQIKPEYYLERGQLTLHAHQIQLEGVGQALRRIERLRRQLEAEGLFSPEHLLPLPVLPKKIGLIVGDKARAHGDVVNTGKARWPLAEFVICKVAVQGPRCVGEVCAALDLLERDPQVEVIIIARGGGGFEDLLPFSDEQMVRKVFALSKPVVSAIGHQADKPLLDLVSHAAITPTAAAKMVLPDFWHEVELLATLQKQLRSEITNRIEGENQHLQTLRTRPVLKDPGSVLKIQADHLAAYYQRLNSGIANLLGSLQYQLDGDRKALAAYSPKKVLDRGYAIVRSMDSIKPQVIRRTQQIRSGESLNVMFASGQAQVKVEAIIPVSGDK